MDLGDAVGPLLQQFPPAELGRRIQAYLRAYALRMTDHERVGPFLASFDCENDNPYRSYAVPDDGAFPSPVDVEALIAAFVRRRRTPRLEYVAEAAPAVEPALMAKEFRPEKRFPLLICVPAMLCDISAGEVEIGLAQDDRDVVAAAEVGAEAFGGAVYPDPLRQLVEHGGVLLVVRDEKTRSVVGAGIGTPAHDGVSEVAGIGVRAAFRCRGIGGAVTAAVAREMFARGFTLAWTTPGHDRAERTYQSAGFVRATEQLHISRRK
ncbi:MAG TPA: GNAT family N-acetyltransferase [Rhizomicrobium sp.]